MYSPFICLSIIPGTYGNIELVMNDVSASQQIDTIIKMHDGWKGVILTKIRRVIRETSSTIIEEVKWKMPSLPEGRPVWSYNGILCIAEVFKNDIKLTFFKGALLKDPQKLFNARLKSRTDRAIEFHEGDDVNETALRELILEAMEINAR